MLQSEQLDTVLVLAANDELAAGLLIQRMPAAGEGNLAHRRGSAENEDQIGANEDYNRIAHLAASLTREELLSLDADTILHRLFWEENLLRFEPLQGARGPRFACSCSRARVSAMLRSLGEPEAESILAERGEVEVGCEFVRPAVPLRRRRRGADFCGSARCAECTVCATRAAGAAVKMDL